MIVRTNGVRILSFAAAVGKKEGEGPLKNRFDYIDTDDRFGMETWEKAESSMFRRCFTTVCAVYKHCGTGNKQRCLNNSLCFAFQINFPFHL